MVYAVLNSLQDGHKKTGGQGGGQPPLNIFEIAFSLSFIFLVLFYFLKCLTKTLIFCKLLRLIATNNNRKKQALVKFNASFLSSEISESLLDFFDSSTYI